jgi:hypothetical protein
MSIVDSGHIYAMGLASSSLTPSARLSEILGGLNQVLCFGVSSLRGGGGERGSHQNCLPQVDFMKSVAELEDLEDVTNKIIKIAAHVLENTAFR